MTGVNPRLASGVRVAALLRQVQGRGGFGTVLARGDDTAGSIAIVARDRGEARLLEPVLGKDAGYSWREVTTGDAVDGWIERARRRDPDLWVIELDIPDAARFIAESFGSD